MVEMNSKGKWVWVAFTDEELELCGYHRLISGLLY